MIKQKKHDIILPLFGVVDIFSEVHIILTIIIAKGGNRTLVYLDLKYYL